MIRLQGLVGDRGEQALRSYAHRTRLMAVLPVPGSPPSRRIWHQTVRPCRENKGLTILSKRIHRA